MKKILALIGLLILVSGCANNPQFSGASQKEVPVSGPALNKINHLSNEVTVLDLGNRVTQKNIHKGENSYTCFSYPHFTAMDCMGNGGKPLKITKIEFRSADYMPTELTLYSNEADPVLCVSEETHTLAGTDNTTTRPLRSATLDCSLTNHATSLTESPSTAQ